MRGVFFHSLENHKSVAMGLSCQPEKSAKRSATTRAEARIRDKFLRGAEEPPSSYCRRPSWMLHTYAAPLADSFR
jgi:hypothetical protein